MLRAMNVRPLSPSCKQLGLPVGSTDRVALGLHQLGFVRRLGNGLPSSSPRTAPPSLRNHLNPAGFLLTHQHAQEEMPTAYFGIRYADGRSKFEYIEYPCELSYTAPTVLYCSQCCTAHSVVLVCPG